MRTLLREIKNTQTLECLNCGQDILRTTFTTVSELLPHITGDGHQVQIRDQKFEILPAGLEPCLRGDHRLAPLNLDKIKD